MSSNVLGSINWAAIGASVLLAFAISFVWYGLLFSKAWTRALGISVGDIQDLKMGVVAPYLTALVTYVVLGVGMAMLVTGWTFARCRMGWRSAC
jgi:hypothetical protein